jgi:hypothetical protein
MRHLMAFLIVIITSQVPCKAQTLYQALLHSTVKIISVDKNQVPSSGTGFFYAYIQDGNSNSSIPVIVTCKHVIENSVTGFLDFSLAKTNSYARTEPHFLWEIPNFRTQWILHPDTNIDIAIYPIGQIMNKLIEDGKRLDTFQFTKIFFYRQMKRAKSKHFRT